MSGNPRRVQEIRELVDDLLTDGGFTAAYFAKCARLEISSAHRWIRRLRDEGVIEWRGDTESHGYGPVARVWVRRES